MSEPYTIGVPIIFFNKNRDLINCFFYPSKGYYCKLKGYIFEIFSDIGLVICGMFSLKHV